MIKLFNLMRKKSTLRDTTLLMLDRLNHCECQALILNRTCADTLRVIIHLDTMNLKLNSRIGTVSRLNETMNWIEVSNGEFCRNMFRENRLPKNTTTNRLEGLITCNTCIILLNGNETVYLVINLFSFTNKFVHHHGDQNKQLNHRLVSYLYPKMIYFSVRLPIR